MATDPSVRSAASQQMLRRTRLIRDVYGGTETLRARGRTYLPQYERETDKRYDIRLQGATALNKLREAVEAASAKPFSTLLSVTGGDDDLQHWITDVDLRGQHLHLFAHRLFNDALAVGQCHILIDHPDTTDLPNLAAQRAAEVRPFFKMIRDEDLLAAYVDYVGGDARVVHARIAASRIERNEDFEEIVYDQVWVLEADPRAGNGRVELWEQERGTGAEWAKVGEKPMQWAEVPLVSLVTGEEEGDFVTRPMFLDLAHKQIEHWISSSDQRSILSVARFPILAGSGIQIDEEDAAALGIGPFKMLISPDAQGRFYYVEPDGKAIESGFKDLAMLEMHMDMMALNPVVSTHRQYVPQNERDIQETRVHSVVQDCAISCKQALERALRFMGVWTNRDYADVRVNIVTDFSSTANKMREIALLISAWEKRGISRETFLAEAKKRDLFGDDFDIRRELDLWRIVDEMLARGLDPARQAIETDPINMDTGYTPQTGRPGPKPAADSIAEPTDLERPFQVT